MVAVFVVASEALYDIKYQGHLYYSAILWVEDLHRVYIIHSPCGSLSVRVIFMIELPKCALTLPLPSCCPL